jgi:hypothetical protein
MPWATVCAFKVYRIHGWVRASWGHPLRRVWWRISIWGGGILWRRWRDVLQGRLPRFAEDYDLHQGWFLLFNYHYGTLKFDVKIFDGTQC